MAIELPNSPPLVVRVDVPDDSLGEDLVLVERDEAAQSEWADLLHHDGVGGTIAFKDLVGRNRMGVNSSENQRQVNNLPCGA